ncbi:MAG: cell division protein FtsQ [Bacilli bacterium]
MANLQPAQRLTDAQKMMVFILSMATFGVADILTEIIPEISLGPIDISIAYFAFIPLTLAILFDPVRAAIGAALGEVVFSDLILGDFGGLSEVEGFLQLSLALIIAGSIVKDPRNKGQLITAALVGVGIDKILGGIVDVTKIFIGVEEFEAVEGLPNSVLALEGIAFLTDMLITGVLFGVIPVLYLVPKLYGKIEPLLGIAPRTPENGYKLSSVLSAKNTLLLLVILFVSGGVAILGETDFNFGEWEPDFVDKFGDQYMYWVMAAGLLLATVVVLLMKKNGRKSVSK